MFGVRWIIPAIFMSGRSERRWLALLAIVARVYFFAANLNFARSEEFPRLPDGRVVIEIYGQQLAFRQEDVDLEHIELPALQLNVQPSPSWDRSGKMWNSDNLKYIVNYPNKFRDAVSEHLGWMIVWMNNYPHNKPFIGLFDQTQYDARLTHVLGINIRRDDYTSPGLVPIGDVRFIHPASVNRFYDGLTDDGFIILNPFKDPAYASFDRSPTVLMERYYVLDGSQRIRPSSTNLIVRCSYLNAPPTEKVERICGSSIATRNYRVVVGWSWHEERFPAATWRELDDRLRQIANQILINKPFGELE